MLKQWTYIFLDLCNLSLFDGIIGNLPSSQILLYSPGHIFSAASTQWFIIT